MTAFLKSFLLNVEYKIIYVSEFLNKVVDSKRNSE